MRSGERFSEMAEEIEAYYTGDNHGDAVRITYGSFLDGKYTDLDIRDAVFLRYQLDGAIQDYERAVGK